MMNARILELIKNPYLIAKDDLSLLESEIEKHPYIQSVRALHLYGIHAHQADDYQNTLSTTAAFTTDKKILYQFINKVPLTHAEPKVAVAENVAIPPDMTPVESTSNFTEITSAPKTAIKPVYVDGVLNRILFEGEEDFLESNHDAIDLEQTQETGLIVTQSVKKTEETTAAEATPALAKREDSIQTIDRPKVEVDIIEEQPQDEAPVQKDESEKTIEQEPEQPASESLNFHGTEEFLPDVKSLATPSRLHTYKVPKATPNKHELEMQRLIAEVEAKMKTRKKQVPPEEETVGNSNLDFADVQDMAVSDPKPNDVILEVQNEEEQKIISENLTVESTHETIATAEKPAQREWKPIAINGTTPDSLITKEIEPQITRNNAEEQTVATPDYSLLTDEKSTFNISFFTQKVSSIETEKADELIQDVKKHVEEDAAQEESNIPVFINTWQNWLKIDKNRERTEETPVVSREEEKNKVIETFIVKEPRISKLREESDFVVKERGDNISHLMTETLAKLYIEQKLYTKAIKAYQTLTEKHPDKKSYFAEQIKFIKDLRQTK